VCDCFRDKDNNSAVISLGEPCSEAAAAHQSSVAANDVTVEESLVPHRAVVNRCGSPPTGRSVSFMCSQDTSDTARRRQSSEQKDAAVGVAVPSLSVTSSPCAVHHIEDEKFCRLASSSDADVITGAAVIGVCYCVNSKHLDVDGCLC